MEAKGTSKIGRRAVLGAVLGGMAATAAAAVTVPSSVLGTNGDVMHVGQSHDATNATWVTCVGEHAIQATSDVGDGLRGFSAGGNSSGVFGNAYSATGFGVYGFHVPTLSAAALGAPTAAVWAVQGSAPLALEIYGKAQFSRSGTVTIPKGAQSKTLPVAPVTAATFGLATLQQLRTNLYVQCVVKSGASLKVYLNRAAPSATRVAWVAFERP